MCNYVKCLRNDFVSILPKHYINKLSYYLLTYVSIDIGNFEGTFLLQVKDGAMPYLAPPQCVAYILQQPFRDEFDVLQNTTNIGPPPINETSEWYNSFVLVLKCHKKV